MRDIDASENNISIISVIVEDRAVANRINDLLNQYGDYIVGRLGVPYKDKRISVICIVLDAPSDIVSALSGKLGMYQGVSTKTVVSKKKY
ncbi:MAG: iron-only hydrogenase system regulator [Oscillospiraceae bacterium]|nr:iron-only hydrogenase system regulator [Oscillospiraceae bacterium]